MTLIIITLSLFLLLTLIEFGLIYYRWSELQDIHSVGKIITPIVGIDNKYNNAIDWVTNKLIKLKKFVWIPVTTILILNLITSITISGIGYLIYSLLVLCVKTFQ